MNCKFRVLAMLTLAALALVGTRYDSGRTAGGQGGGGLAGIPDR